MKKNIVSLFGIVLAKFNDLHDDFLQFFSKSSNFFW